MPGRTSARRRCSSGTRTALESCEYVQGRPRQAVGARSTKAQDKCFLRLERLREMGHELRRPEADIECGGDAAGDAGDTSTKSGAAPGGRTPRPVTLTSAALARISRSALRQCADGSSPEQRPLKSAQRNRAVVRRGAACTRERTTAPSVGIRSTGRRISIWSSVLFAIAGYFWPGHAVCYSDGFRNPASRAVDRTRVGKRWKDRP
jgi:hypothetical protein